MVSELKTKEELLNLVDRLVVLYEGMHPLQHVVRLKEENFPTITLYKNEREAKLEIFMSWKKYENPVSVLRDAYAVICKTAYHLIDKELCEMVTNYAFVTPKRRESRKKLEHMMDSSWLDD